MIFEKLNIRLEENPYCTQPLKDSDINPIDFDYYDVDGFELNIAERKYYKLMGFPVNDIILNNCCWQEPWYKIKESFSTKFIINHAMYLCRAAYSKEALYQINNLTSYIPTAKFLINTKIKWGYDFSLFANYENDLFEVIHIEYDNRNFNLFTESMKKFETFVENTDWEDAAKKIYDNREKWKNLIGFDQNDFKAKYLLGWDKAEYREKAIY